MKLNIRSLYLYLFSFIGLLLIIIGSVQLVDLGLKMTVFKDADSYEAYPARPVSPEGLKTEEVDVQQLQEYQQKDLTRRRQRQASTAIAMLTIGTPVYIYHWKKLHQEK